MSQNRSSICVALAIASTVLLPATVVSAADETFAPTTVISLPSGQKIQSFDISFVDPVTGIYILGDRTNTAVDVIDTTTNTVLTQLIRRICRLYREQRYLGSRRRVDRRATMKSGWETVTARSR